MDYNNFKWALRQRDVMSKRECKNCGAIKTPDGFFDERFNMCAYCYRNWE